MKDSTRPLVGYGRNRPRRTWPNGSGIEINVVVNYEEGTERSFAMGDSDREVMTEKGSYAFPPKVRNLAMGSMHEYGSRVGTWRVLDALSDAGIRPTFFACVMAFEQNPEVVAGGHEACSNGYRWEEVFRLSGEEEREHINMAIASFERTRGKRPVGWYCRYWASIQTRELIAEEGGFLYDPDAYNDDAPYFVAVGDQHRLVVPYTADVNEIRFWNSTGMTSSEDFFDYERHITMSGLPRAKRLRVPG